MTLTRGPGPQAIVQEDPSVPSQCFKFAASTQEINGAAAKWVTLRQVEASKWIILRKGSFFCYPACEERNVAVDGIQLHFACRAAV